MKMATDKKISQYVSSVMTVEELIKSKTSAGIIPIDDSNELLSILYGAREHLESGDGKKQLVKFFVPSFEEVELYFQVYSGNKSKSQSFTQVFMDFRFVSKQAMAVVNEPAVLSNTISFSFV